MSDPGLLAYADQRMAEAKDFLDAMIERKEEFAPLGFDEAVGVSHLSALLDGKSTAAEALSDALAQAINRLAS
jgi:hypothetical protein